MSEQESKIPQMLTHAWGIVTRVKERNEKTSQQVAEILDTVQEIRDAVARIESGQSKQEAG